MIVPVSWVSAWTDDTLASQAPAKQAATARVMSGQMEDEGEQLVDGRKCMKKAGAVPGHGLKPCKVPVCPGFARSAIPTALRLTCRLSNFPFPAISMTQDILGVTFDAGGTLLEPWPSVGAVYAEVAAAHGVPGLEAAELTRRFREGWRRRPEFGFTCAEWEALVDETFAGLTPEPPSRTFFPALYRRFDEADVWRVFEDVLPTLEALRQRGLKLAVVSNWDDRLEPLLERLGLRQWFSSVVVSLRVGARKPEPRIYGQAATALGLPPAQILHVGDEWAADVAGARTAGFHALHLRRGGGPSGVDWVTDLRELPARLAPSPELD